jgi:hypothetical protein
MLHDNRFCPWTNYYDNYLQTIEVDDEQATMLRHLIEW